MFLFRIAQSLMALFVSALGIFFLVLGFYIFKAVCTIPQMPLIPTVYLSFQGSLVIGMGLFMFVCVKWMTFPKGEDNARNTH